MARTTAELVKGVLRLGSEGGDYDDISSPSLDPYIDAASVLMDRVAQCAIDVDNVLTTVELELIERWLAAHFYGMSDQPYSSSSTSGASGSHQGQTGMYLEGTKYGQMASALDTSGCLSYYASGGGRATGSGAWLGKAKADRRSYRDRHGGW